MLKHDLKAYIPVERGEYAVDYKATHRDGGRIDVLIAAIPEKIISDYISIFDELNMTVISADIYQNCIAKAFLHEKNALIISEGSGRLLLSFSDSGVLSGSRDIPFTSKDMVINEISKLFDSFLTSRVFESAHILNESLQFLRQYFDSLDMRCINTAGDFLALERSMSKG